MVVGRSLAATMLLLSAALACAGSSTGNGRPDCVELCEAGKKKRCPGAEALDCESNCLSEDARAETSSCRGTYDSTLTCSAALEDICTVAKACSAEVNAYLACVAKYCKDNDAEFCP
jgi:hypothetical protein